MKTVLKICAGNWINANRDERELSVCRELGADTMVMAKGATRDRCKKELVDGFDVYRCSSRPLGERMPKGMNRIASLFSWAHEAKAFHADVISGHDMIGLLIGWISNCMQSRRKRAKLVYDSHEFEMGRSATRGKIQRWAIKQLERFLMKRCVFSIMVNDVIADEVQKIHGLQERPIVVRSTPNLWTIDPAVCQSVRREWVEELGGKEYFLLMYHGGVMKGRGIEVLIDLVQKNMNIAAVILGNGGDGYLQSLKKRAQDAGVKDRILFKPAVPITELWKFVGAVDVGMITIPAISKSYYYMLPNKFFENIQSETPVICSNFPAIKEIVDQYQIGLTCDPNDLNAMSDCIESMRTDHVCYQACKRNLKKAKKDLCWENEKKELIRAYKDCL